MTIPAETVGEPGRLYRRPSKRWLWALNETGRDINPGQWSLNGVVDTKDEAAATVERAYDLCRKPGLN